MPRIISSKSNLTSITVEWNELKCIEQNSNITGYTIRVINETVLISVSSDTREFAVVDLFPSTLYTIEIAAESANGTGPFQSISNSTLQPTGT